MQFVGLDPEDDYEVRCSNAFLPDTIVVLIHHSPTDVISCKTDPWKLSRCYERKHPTWQGNQGSMQRTGYVGSIGNGDVDGG